VAVNCAAIPETLLEAELFGFERGAFTDARQAKAGLFQTAHRGVLFLDEIGLLPANLQAKLLTALEEGVVRRLGSTRAERVDTWIISATSEDLKAAPRRRGFREDLYHRLAVVTLRLPPLRDRRQDILTLAEHFLARTCSEYGLAPKALTVNARQVLMAHRWPGNVREVANVMERAALLVDRDLVTADDLELATPRTRNVSPSEDRDTARRDAPVGISLGETVEEIERRHIGEALHETRWNISRAAKRLGVTRDILRYRVQKYGLERPPATAEPAESTDELHRAVQPTVGRRPVTVQWERRHVALLRADLAPTGATPVPAMDGGLGTIVEKIESFGGQVEELSRGGLVAVFGLEPVEDAPRRAAHAALAIQRITANASDRSAESSTARIGLHVGEVLIGWVGNVARVDHAAKREALQQLEALMRSAEAGIVLVSEATRPFLERRFVLAPIVPGDGTAGTSRRLVGLERTGLGLGERLTPFVGRRRELEQFAQALTQAQSGHGQVVAVVGEAGVGKSRLFWEFIESHRSRNSRVLFSSAASYGKETPYLPVTELLKAYFQIDPRDDPSRVRERVTEKVLSLEPALAPVLSALLTLLDVPVADAQWSALDPQQRRRRTLEAVKLLLLEESRLRPVIVLFEDLHWIDSETQAVLDILVESLPSHRILLLVSYRPEHQHAWGGKTYYRQLRIDPLPPESANELLEVLLGNDEALGPVKQLLVERTEANPLFLEESVRALVETADLVGERGAYRLIRPVEHLTIPATVQAILAARIDRLAPEVKRLLQAAAVIGKDVPMPLLLAIADVPEREVGAALTQLRAAEFLYETRRFPDLEYTFKHALTHEVAYGLLHERQRLLDHARITEAIERLAAERVTEQAERLAYHALRGELWEKGVAYLRHAGHRALARAANREAITHLEQALGALRRLPETRKTTELAIDIRIDLRNALVPVDDQVRMGNVLREAETLARTLGDLHRLARVATYMVIQGLIAGDYDESLRFGQEALAIARTLGDRSIEVVATTFLGRTHMARGELSNAVTMLAQNVAREGDLRHERFGAPGIQSAVSGADLADVLSQLGQFDEAIRHAEAAVRIAEAADHPFTVYRALLALGLAHFRRGDSPRASWAFERSLDLCRTWQIVVGTPLIAAALAATYARAARADEAILLVAGAVEEFRSRQTHLRPSFVLLCAGMTYLSAGRIDEAASYAREALALARRLGARGSEAHALYLAGDVATTSGGEDASGYYRKALAIADELSMRPLMAHCHLGLGKLYRRTGKGQEAQEHFGTATAMYREMDMRFWLEQAEAEKRELR
jgi:tetratricopeptide (TPR) repeat protein/MoxR-like ATPase